MGENRQLLLGIDLTDEFVQISVYQYQTQDVVTALCSSEDANPRIPACLLVKESTKEWVCGEEAKRFAKLASGVFIDSLLSKLKERQSIEVYQAEFTPVMLMTKFFKKLLGEVRKHYANASIAKLVLSVDEPYGTIGDQLYESLAALGLERDRVTVSGRIETFMYYILNQNPQLWANEVGLFHFDEERAYYYRLSVNRYCDPKAVSVKKIDLSEEFQYPMLTQEEQSKLSFRFEKAIGQLLFKRLVTSIFFTGSGFISDWADPVLKKLCVGHRIFKGQNLYTKGACYQAKSMYHEELKDYMLFTEDMITSTISLRVYQEAKEKNLVLAKAGTPWQQVHHRMTVILDRTNEMQFFVSNLQKREPIQEVFRVDHLMERENKTIRLSLELRFVDRETAVITIRDTGFGAFYETTHRIWEQRLAL